MSETPEPARDGTDTLETVVRWELLLLWNDLHWAYRDAANGSWSIRCDGLADRIKLLTGYVGPTPWPEIQILLLEDGIYQRVHSEMGVEVEVDMARVAQSRASIDERTERMRLSMRTSG